MTRILLILAACAATLFAAPAFAQRPQTIRSPQEAAEFCKHSEPRTAEESEQEAYDAARRRTAQRPVQVWLSAEAAPVIEYDRVTGSLELSIYQDAPFARGFAVATNVGTVGFELTEERAHHLRARYEAGTASLRLTFLPLAWSDYDKPLCRQDGERQVLDGEVLAADLVDEVGREVVSYQTALGREVALMRQHRIKGYLNSGTPVVTVSALTPFPTGAPQLVDDTAARLKSRLRAALYGCYLKGLTENGRLQGALVVKMSERETTVLVDSLHDPTTQGCAVERMGEIDHDGLTLKATIIFRLEEAPSL